MLISVNVMHYLIYSLILIITVESITDHRVRNENSKAVYGERKNNFKH